MRNSHNIAASLRIIFWYGGRTGLRSPETLPMGILGPISFREKKALPKKVTKVLDTKEGLQPLDLYYIEERRYRNSFLYVLVTETAGKD